LNEQWTHSADELRVLLNLTQIPGVGGARLRRLIQRFQTPSGVLAATTEELAAVAGINAEIADQILRSENLPFGDGQMQRLFESDFRLITFWDRHYPDLLKHIDDPPVILYVWGEFAPRDGFAVAVVGTRMPTSYGRQVTQKIVADLVAAGVTVVSGLARGIDTLAHTEVVKRGGRTIAVLGSGLDRLYPAENAELARAIAENGAVITECPFGSKPDAVNFPRRNRIISGLSLGTLVVEAREKSGALITANTALEQNREVFAIPGSIFSPQSRGCHELIKAGAKIVSTVDDILEELPEQGELFARQEFVQTLPPDLSETEKCILDHLGQEPVHVDTLARATEISPAELATLLLQLEFQGYVRQLPGKHYVRV